MSKVHPTHGASQQPPHYRPPPPHLELKLHLSSGYSHALNVLGLNKPTTKVDRLAQLDIIRGVPIAIQQKRNIRDDALHQTNTRGYSYQKWKARQRQLWARMKASTREAGEKLELWQAAIKEINGNFGPGVVSYFAFLKMLFKMNVFIGILWLAFVVAPGAYLSESIKSKTIVYANTTTKTNCLNELCDYTNSSTIELASACSKEYYNYTVNSTAKETASHSEYLNFTEDFIDGSGWMEYTAAFQGYYLSSSLDITVNVNNFVGQYSYNLPLAYILVTGAYMLCSLYILAVGSASTVKESMLKSTGKASKYSDLVFSSWNFGLESSSSANLAHRQIKREAKALIDEKRDSERRLHMSRAQKCKVYFLRIVVNLFVLGLLGCAGYLIVYVTQLSAKLRSTYSGFLKLLISYSPSLTLTVLNMILPNLFEKMSRLEDLTPASKLTMALIRSVIVRLAGLAVLIFTMYQQVMCTEDSEDKHVNKCGVHTLATTDCPTLYCWETYVGQQFYKLVLMQLFVLVGVTLLVDFPRRLIATKCGCRLAKMIGQPEFNISANVLELVYIQTVCWFGAFFTPVLPSMVFLLLVIIFYLKKVSLLMNYRPNEESYRSSEANRFFVLLLLLSFVLTMLPISYIVIKLPPSKGCGPFRVYSIMYDVVHVTMCSWPCNVLSAFGFFTSANFVVPLLFALGVTIYYFSALSSVQKKRFRQLEDQLNLEIEAKKRFTREAVAEKTTALSPSGIKPGMGVASTVLVDESELSLLERTMVP